MVAGECAGFGCEKGSEAICLAAASFLVLSSSAPALVRTGGMGGVIGVGGKYALESQSFASIVMFYMYT